MNGIVKPLENAQDYRKLVESTQTGKLFDFFKAVALFLVYTFVVLIIGIWLGGMIESGALTILLGN